MEHGELRWFVVAASDLNAVLFGDGTCRVLRQWKRTPRKSECGGIDYSRDGTWVDVPVDGQAVVVAAG